MPTWRPGIATGAGASTALRATAAHTGRLAARPGWVGAASLAVMLSDQDLDTVTQTLFALTRSWQRAIAVPRPGQPAPPRRLVVRAFADTQAQTMGVQDVATALRTPLSTASRLVANGISDGLLEAVDPFVDSRYRLCRLSRQGRKLLADLRADDRRMLAAATAHWSSVAVMEAIELATILARAVDDVRPRPDPEPAAYPRW